MARRLARRFPTIETLGAQAGALAFVIGSYVAAERLGHRRTRRAAQSTAPAVRSGLAAPRSPRP
jgi:hypothetical protein